MATKADDSELSGLIALQDTRPLFSPLGQSNRIKYTCIAASPHYVALGANTGGVYCFHRDSLRYIRILSNKEGSVSLLRFSTDELTLAVVCGGGHVGFWELNLQEQGVSKRFHVSSVLKEGVVKAMVWDNRGSRLFYGDDLGRVAVAYIPKLSKKLKLSSTSSLFKKPDEILCQDKSPVVQLDFYQDILLVSTHLRCLLIRLQNGKISQVGRRPRDGPFGACFHGRWGGHPPVVYSARPGGRLWEADIEGTVVSTIKLNDLISIPAMPILGAGFQPDFEAVPSTHLTQPLNLSSLSVLTNRYMVGHLEGALFLFDPGSYRLAAWTCDTRGIVDLCCSGRQLFVLCEGGRSVVVMGVFPVGMCLQELVRYGHLKQAEGLLKAHSGKILQLLPGHKLLYNATKATVEFAKSCDQELPESLKHIESALTEMSVQFESKNLADMDVDCKEEEEDEERETKKDGEEEEEEEEEEEKVVEEGEAEEKDKEGEGEEGMEEEGEGGGVQNIPEDANVMDEQEGGLLPEDEGIPLDKSSHVTKNSFVQDTVMGATANEDDNEGGYPNDVANFDMQDGFEEVDSTDGTDQIDTGLHDLDTTLIPDEHNSSTELTTGLAPGKQSPDTGQSHKRSLSWGGSGDKGEKETGIPNFTGSDLERSFESSSEQRLLKLSPYPESLGIEIPQHSSSQSEVLGLQNASDPSSSMKVSQSGSSSLELHPSELESDPGRPSELGNEAKSNQKFKRSTSFPIQSDLPSRLTSAKNDGTEDDVIAVPVWGSATGSLSKEPGGKSKTGKRRKRKKASGLDRRRSTPEDDIAATLPPIRSSESAHSLLNIPEESSQPPLPFPEAGLPSTPPAYSSLPLPLSHSPTQQSHHSSAATSRSISPFNAYTPSPPRSDSILSNRSSFLSKVKSLTTQIADTIDPPEPVAPTQRTERTSGQKSDWLERFPPGGTKNEKFSGQEGSEQNTQFSVRGRQKPTALLSKMKSFAKQGGQNIKIEPEAIQRPVKVVKDFLSSLTNPPAFTPSQSSRFYDSQYVYRNEGFGEYTVEPVGGLSDQSDLISANVAVEMEEQEASEEILALLRDPRTTALCTATSDTMHHLEDPQVISSPDNIHKVLRDWLHELEHLTSSVPTSLTTQGEEKEEEKETNQSSESSTASLPQVDRGEDMHQAESQNRSEEQQPKKSPELQSEAISSFFQSSLYLSLSEGVRRSVTELATLCAEMGVYSSIVGSSSLLVFVRGFAAVLDVGRVRSLLGTEGWEVRNACWREIAERCPVEDDTVLQLIASDVDSAVDYITINMTALSDRLPAYLTRLHEVQPLAMVDLSVRCFPHILPWEVAIVCGIDQSNEDMISHDPQQVVTMATSVTQCQAPGRVTFGKFLSQCLQDEQTNPAMTEMFQSDPDLMMLSLSVLLQLGPSKTCLLTPDGNPVPWSHLTGWDLTLETLVELCVAMETQHRETARWLCEKHGYWVGVVWLSVTMGDTRRALHTALCLRDMRLFTEGQKWDQLLKSREDWQLLLELMAELRLPAHIKTTHTSKTTPPTESDLLMDASRDYVMSKGIETSSSVISSARDHEEAVTRGSEYSVELEGGPTVTRLPTHNGITAGRSSRPPPCDELAGRTEVTWTHMFRLMLGTLSPSAVTRLLSKVDLNDVPGGGGAEVQLHRLLVRLTAVHTQQRAIAHSLLEKIDRYLWSPRPNSLPPQLLHVHTREKQQQQAEDRLDTTIFPSVVECSSTLEDASSHWGVRSKQGATCGRCRLPLLTSVSDLQPGIIAFCCGHSFHKHCLPEQACTSCFTENLHTALTQHK